MFLDKEDEESGHDDDEEDVDDVNHVTLTKGVVRGNSPDRRSKTSDIWKHVRRIRNHDLTDHEMKTDCTHVCIHIHRLTDDEGETTDTYVCAHGGVRGLDDDEDDE